MLQSVVHLRSYGGFFKGQTSAWPESVVQELVARGIVAILPPPEVAEPAKEMPVRRGIADRVIRKAKTPAGK
jgi:hypothetical protein